MLSGNEGSTSSLTNNNAQAHSTGTCAHKFNYYKSTPEFLHGNPRCFRERPSDSRTMPKRVRTEGGGKTNVVWADA